MKYKIKKGNNSSKPRLIKFWGGKREFNFTFSLDTSCWYPEHYVKESGISKICGVSYGTHAENPLNKIKIFNNYLFRWAINSTIIGWQPDYDIPNQFNLFLIYDNRGIETRPKLGIKIKANRSYAVKMIRISEEKVVEIYIDNILYKVVRVNTLPFGYYLGFYHGGHDSAYHNMQAEMEIQ